MRKIIDDDSVGNIDEDPKTVKPKRQIRDAQREHLNKIRELAMKKKAELKQITLKSKLAKTVPKQDLAKQYDEYVERLHSQAHASEPEPEEIEQTKEEVEEIEEEKPIVKPKRVLTEKQLESLKRAREAAVLKKRELKELAQKAKALPKKEIEVKAAEYDKLEEKKKQLTQPTKKTTKKVIEVEEEEEEEEVVVKKQPKKIINNNNNNSLDQEVSMPSIQQRLKLERQKMLMNTLSPMC